MTKDHWHDRQFAEGWDQAGNLFTNPDRLNQLALLGELLAECAATHLLDLGIGSAQVESSIIRRHPAFFDHCRVTGIDASAAMLTLAKQRCEADSIPRVKLVRGCFSSIDKIELDDYPDTAICVQALHEVTHEVKRSVFSRVHQWLPPERPFYILDRFDYPDGVWHSEWRATWNWMRSTAPGEVLDFDEYHRRYRAKTDYVASVADYRGWLEETGFETVCPYRCFNRALIVARS